MKILLINIHMLILSAVLVTAAMIDLRTQRIPNLLTLSTILAAIIFHTLTNGVSGFLFSLEGTGAGIGLLLLPYLLGGMGAGDAKLMGAVGAVVGAKGVFIAFLLTGLCGGVYALLLVLVNRSRFQVFLKEKLLDLKLLVLTRKYLPDTSPPARPRLCYGLAIAAGSIAYIALISSEYTLWF